MKFEVSRTSNWDSERPCAEAVQESAPSWDVRTFKSPEEFDKHSPDSPWLSVGTEYGFVYGPRGGVTGIKRRLGDKKVWTVEMETLDDLVRFTAKYGECVVGHSFDYGSNAMTIEIYDAYRE